MSQTTSNNDSKQATPTQATPTQATTKGKGTTQATPAQATPTQATPTAATKGKGTKRKGTTRSKKVTTPAATKGKMFVFDRAPGGAGYSAVLRIYFIALIQAQLGGKLQANKDFKLWSGNFSGHTKQGRLYKVGRDIYQLTPRGLEYFSSPKQMPHPSDIEEMVKAIQTGKAPKMYSGQTMREFFPLPK